MISDKLRTKIDFLVVDGDLVGVLIGIHETEMLCAQIELCVKYVNFKIGENSIRLGVEPDHSVHRPADEESGNKYFTTDSSYTNSTDDSDNDSEESMVIALAVNDGDLKYQEVLIKEEKLQRRRIEVAENLSHLPTEEPGQVEKMLQKVDILAWSLHDLRSAEIPVQHKLGLTNEDPIHHRPRRLPPTHDQIINEEVRKMLDAGAIVPATLV